MSLSCRIWFSCACVAKILDVKLKMALYFALTVSNASMMHVRGMVPLNFMGSDALCSDAVGGTHVDAIGSRLELLVAVAARSPNQGST